MYVESARTRAARCNFLAHATPVRVCAVRVQAAWQRGRLRRRLLLQPVAVNPEHNGPDLRRLQAAFCERRRRDEEHGAGRRTLPRWLCDVLARCAWVWVIARTAPTPLPPHTSARSRSRTGYGFRGRANRLRGDVIRLPHSKRFPPQNADRTGGCCFTCCPVRPRKRTPVKVKDAQQRCAPLHLPVR
jgi:hypothetical protein